MTGQPRRDDKIKPPASRPRTPWRQTAQRLKPAKASGAGIWQRNTASGYRVLASCRSKRSLGSMVIVKPLGTTAFRSERSGTRRPENKTYGLSEVGGT